MKLVYILTFPVIMNVFLLSFLTRDWSQVCSPIDAIENYLLAISECRSLIPGGDLLFLAGALEGYACAALLMLQLGLTNVEDVLGRDLRTYMPTASLLAEGGGAIANPEAAAMAAAAAAQISGAANPTNSLGLVVSNVDLVARVLLLAEDRVKEAIAIYSKNVMFCTLEVSRI